MESVDLLSNLGKIAGIAGVVVGVLFLTFQSIIQKSIFPNLTKEHGFRIIRMIIVASTVVAIVGIGAWIYGNQQAKDAQKIEVRVEGRVTDVNGNGLGYVVVNLLDIEGLNTKTDSEGNYALNISGNGKSDYTLEFKRNGLGGKTKNLHLVFEEDAQTVVANISLSEIVTEAVSDEASDKKDRGGTNSPGEYIPVSPSSSSNNGGSATINLFYNDEGIGCQLDVIITIGGVQFVPTGNSIQLSGLVAGLQTYSVTGTAFCPNGGSCNVTGSGKLRIVNGDQYYMVFDPYLTCIATMMDQADYENLINAVY